MGNKKNEMVKNSNVSVTTQMHGDYAFLLINRSYKHTAVKELIDKFYCVKNFFMKN